MIANNRSQLVFTSDVGWLADYIRTSFSGSCGAGLTDLYMTQLGYSLRCNGRQLVAPPNKVFDFAYDGPPTAGRGIVIAEAKGSVASAQQTSSTRAERNALSAYDQQVADYIGHTASGAPILHGYAVAMVARPGEPARLHVRQTRRTESRDLFTVGAPTSRPVSRYNIHVTLGNYETVFRLIGANQLADAIQATSHGRWLGGVPSQQEPMSTFTFRNREYVRARLPTLPVFGLRKDVFELVRQGLEQIWKQPLRHMLPTHFPVELPRIDYDLEEQLRYNDIGAEFPDGLAFVGESWSSSYSWREFPNSPEPSVQSELFRRQPTTANEDRQLPRDLSLKTTHHPSLHRVRLPRTVKPKSDDTDDA
jgi:hypothetical protein